MSFSAVGVIPARLGSTRLSEKVLREIDGKTMLEHVYACAKQSTKLQDVLIATDDEKVKACAEGFGAKVLLTREDHPNGTSRIAEVAKGIDADVFINIQGDQPVLDAGAIDAMVDALEADSDLDVVTLAIRMTDRDAYQNPNVVKVVVNDKGNALYFSRGMIPYDRDAEKDFSFLKHLGLYGYRKKFLLDFVTWEAGRLEEIEKLEQLRILENGFPIRVLETSFDIVSVDTEEDLKTAESRLNTLKTGS